MPPNGAIKTIGRAPRALEVEELHEQQLVVEHVLRADEEHAPLTHRERNMRLRVLELERQLHTAAARAHVMTMGGEESNLSKPVGTVFERQEELERRVFAMEQMTDAARIEAVKSLYEDMKTYRRQHAKWLEDVEKDVAKLVETSHRTKDRR